MSGKFTTPATSRYLGHDFNATRYSEQKRENLDQDFSTPFDQRMVRVDPSLTNQLERQVGLLNRSNPPVGSGAPLQATHTPLETKEESFYTMKEEMESFKALVMELRRELKETREIGDEMKKEYAFKLEVAQQETLEAKIKLEQLEQAQKKVLSEEEEKHRKQIRELEMDKKSQCDHTRMLAVVNQYVKKHSYCDTKEDFERNLMPFLKAFADTDKVPDYLLDVSAEPWIEDDETPVQRKKRLELYYLLTNVISKGVKEKLETVIRESRTNDAQAIYKHMCKLLKRGETLGEPKVALDELRALSMASTGKNLHGFGAEIVRYQNLCKDLGIEQSEQLILIPQYIDGMAPALKEIRQRIETKVDEGELETLIEVIQFAEATAQKKGLGDHVIKRQNSQEVKKNEQQQPPSRNRARKIKAEEKKAAEQKDKAQLEKQVHDLKHQLSTVLNAVQLQQSAQRTEQKDCWHGAKCTRDNCKFLHPNQGARKPQDIGDIWCGKCEKKTSHTTEQHGKCWNCGEGGHRAHNCKNKQNGNQKGAPRTSLFVGSQNLQFVKDDGKEWVVIQNNLKVRVLDAAEKDAAESTTGAEKPVFVMPPPALGRMMEIVTGYTSLGAKPMKGLCAPESGQVRVPQPPKWTKKARKKKKQRVMKTEKVSDKEKSRKIDGRKRGKMTKHKRWRVKACRFRRKKIRMRSKRKPNVAGARNRKYSAPWSANKMFFKLEWHRKPSMNQRKKAAQKMKARRLRRARFIQDMKNNMAEKARHLQFKKELLAEIALRQIETTEHRKWSVIFELRTMFTWKRKMPKALNKWKAVEDGVKETARQLAQTVQYVVGIQKELTQTILDSGAMVNSGCSKKTTMDNLKPLQRPVEVLGCTGASTVCTRSGEWTLPTMHSKHDLTLQNVLDIPDSHQNLVSVGCLDDAGMKTVFEKQEGRVYAPDGELMLVFKKLDGLYVLEDNKGKVMKVNPQKVMQWEVANLLKIHQALGHISFKRCRALMNFPPESMDSPDPVCTGCLKAQMVLLKSDKEGQRAAPRYHFKKISGRL